MKLDIPVINSEKIPQAIFSPKTEENKAKYDLAKAQLAFGG
jgi:hypothetical protein